MIDFLTEQWVDYRPVIFCVRKASPDEAAPYKHIFVLVALLSLALRGWIDVFIWSVSEAGQSKASLMPQVGFFLQQNLADLVWWVQIAFNC